MLCLGGSMLDIVGSAGILEGMGTEALAICDSFPDQWRG